MHQTLYLAPQEGPHTHFSIYSALANWRSCMHKLWEASTPQRFCRRVLDGVASSTGNPSKVSISQLTEIQCRRQPEINDQNHWFSTGSAIPTACFMLVFTNDTGFVFVSLKKRHKRTHFLFQKEII